MMITADERRESNRIARRKFYEKNRDRLLAENRDWYQRNRSYRKAYRKRFGREQALKSKYGLSLEQFEELLKRQNNCCAICRERFLSTKDTHVDHCHKTKKIRGLLCYRCNHGLGKFKDNVRNLIRAAGYLLKTWSGVA